MGQLDCPMSAAPSQGVQGCPWVPAWRCCLRVRGGVKERCGVCSGWRCGGGPLPASCWDRMPDSKVFWWQQKSGYKCQEEPELGKSQVTVCGAILDFTRLVR